MKSKNDLTEVIIMKTNAEIKSYIKNFIPIEGDDAIVTDANLTEFLLDNCDIFFTDSSRYFCQTRVAGEMYITYTDVLQKRFQNLCFKKIICKLLFYIYYKII